MIKSPVIGIEHLSVSYSSLTPALTDINLEIEEGDFLGILGPNGGGKSTLMKAILGLIPIQEGKITISPSSRLAYVPQFSSMDREFPITASEVVLSAFLKGKAHPFFRFSAEQKNKAMAYLEKTGIKGLEKRQIGQLSGGECQKLLIARALAMEPSILLLDEPTASIDTASREHIFSLLDSLEGKLTILLITHDTASVQKRLKHMAYINEKLLYYGVAKAGVLGND